MFHATKKNFAAGFCMRRGRWITELILARSFAILAVGILAVVAVVPVSEAVPIIFQGSVVHSDAIVSLGCTGGTSECNNPGSLWENSGNGQINQVGTAPGHGAPIPLAAPASLQAQFQLGSYAQSGHAKSSADEAAGTLKAYADAGIGGPCVFPAGTPPPIGCAGGSYNAIGWADASTRAQIRDYFTLSAPTLVQFQFHVSGGTSVGPSTINATVNDNADFSFWLTNGVGPDDLTNYVQYVDPLFVDRRGSYTSGTYFVAVGLPGGVPIMFDTLLRAGIFADNCDMGAIGGCLAGGTADVYHTASYSLLVPDGITVAGNIPWTAGTLPTQGQAPEPATLALISLGLAGLGAIHRRKG